MKLAPLFIAGVYAGDHHRNLKQHNQEKEETLSQVFKLVLDFSLAMNVTQSDFRAFMKSVKVIYHHQIMNRKILKSIGVISPDNRFWNL